MDTAFLQSLLTDPYTGEEYRFSETSQGVNASHRGATPRPAPTTTIKARVLPMQTPSSILDTLESADALLDRRYNIVTKLAPLRARFGGSGYVAERLFKAEVAPIELEIRATFAANNEKPTEGKVDATVRTDPRYIELLTKDVQDKTQWVQLEAELEDVEHRLKIRQTDAYLLSAEARLTPAA